METSSEAGETVMLTWASWTAKLKRSWWANNIKWVPRKAIEQKYFPLLHPQPTDADLLNSTSEFRNSTSEFRNSSKSGFCVKSKIKELDWKWNARRKSVEIFIVVKITCELEWYLARLDRDELTETIRNKHSIPQSYSPAPSRLNTALHIHYQSHAVYRNNFLLVVDQHSYLL